jgi:hypothetical protein
VASTLSPEFLQKVLDKAIEQTVRLSLGAVQQAMGADGETFGNLPVTGGDYVAFYVDLQQRNVLPYVRMLNPDLADRMSAEYDREFAKMIQVA